MNKKVIKSYTLSEMKDRLVGVVGTRERDEYESKLKKEVMKRNSKKK